MSFVLRLICDTCFPLPPEYYIGNIIKKMISNETLIKISNDSSIWKDHHELFRVQRELSDRGVPKYMYLEADRVLNKSGGYTVNNGDTYELRALEKCLHAADVGYAKAYGLLGRYYYRKGKTQNIKLARDYFKKGAAENDPCSIYFLGLMFLRGNGCRKNEGKALSHFEEAASMELEAAIARLAICYWQGECVGKNTNKAAAILQDYKLESDQIDYYEADDHSIILEIEQFPLNTKAGKDS